MVQIVGTLGGHRILFLALTPTTGVGGFGTVSMRKKLPHIKWRWSTGGKKTNSVFAGRYGLMGFPALARSVAAAACREPAGLYRCCGIAIAHVPRPRGRAPAGCARSAGAQRIWHTAGSRFPGFKPVQLPAVRCLILVYVFLKQLQ
jgi:hypothetical protein